MPSQMLFLRSFAAGLLLSGYFVLLAPFYSNALTDVPHFVGFILTSLGLGLFIGGTIYCFMESMFIGVINVIVSMINEVLLKLFKKQKTAA